MSAIPANTIEHNRDNPDGRNQACPLANHSYDGEELYCFAVGGGT
jgi:hypothetical protein